MAEDRYANWMGISVTESAANTQTSKESLTGVGFNTGKGMLIDQIDYFVPVATIALMTASGDEILFGIASSSGITDLEDVADSRILHSGSFHRRDHGTAASAIFIHAPIQFQFFPSLIHAHQRLFLVIKGTGLATVGSIRARIYWRFIDLKDRDIAELVQATLLQG